MTNWFRKIGWTRTQLREELPLRSELLSADQMELFGKTLAGSHAVSSKRSPDQLLARLAANESTLISVCNILTATVKANHRLTPAGEWLFDNFHLLEEQIRTAKHHLPKNYSRELPCLVRGTSAGLPRVYDIALQTISHGDGRVDTETLSRFVAAYQTVTTLQLGELWAIPIMLRLALIENLRRVAVHIEIDRLERNLAVKWADEMIKVAEVDPKGLILIISDMARSNPPMTAPFVSEFVRRLQGQNRVLALPLQWIEQCLAESHRTIEELVQSDNQQQAVDQISVSNSIGSLRIIGAVDWRDFTEAASAIESILRKDPSGVYDRMDFITRDRYRHVVEQLAKASALSEVEVAQTTLQLAQENAAKGRDHETAAHVGFHLIGKGLPDLERTVQARLSSLERLYRISHRFSLFFYLSVIALITFFLTSALVIKAYEGGARDWLMGVMYILVLIATSQLAVALVNWVAQLLVKPHPLPRMDFSTGIPATTRALVVVPTMLTNQADILNLVEALEVRFLANRDRNLDFGLLTDFLDANQEMLPEDEALLQIARNSIEKLNQKYGDISSQEAVETKNVTDDGFQSGGQFFLFHRPRRWNPQEGAWMGFERKRGKLADLNALLRGRAGNAFSLIEGNTTLLSEIKYVITLDTDTQLPRDSARQFVGAMAHPLNIPRFGGTGQGTNNNTLVTEGYGILQPRIDVSLPGTNRSRYAQLFSGEIGIDPYTRTVSDVYQDLFGEGSFIGKGIYDVDAFELALAGRFPINRILSHDLLEGSYARAGLLADVQLYEEFPARYSADVSRRHRWIRGDWQLASWLFSRIPSSSGSYQRNPLSPLSQWKLFDNLRRSLVPAALALLLLLGWLVLPHAWFWTLAVISILFTPVIISALFNLLLKPREVLLRQHLIAAMRAAGRQFGQVSFTLACLPYEAYFSLDAIARTGVRLLITHRKMLQWKPSHEIEREPNQGISPTSYTSLGATYRLMWIAPAIAVMTFISLTIKMPTALIVALPVLLLWAVSPAITWWISRPIELRNAELKVDQILFLRQIARRTWRFFETFVGKEDNWLPPDNFQEHPVATIAHRTSPTNIGLALLANITAYDFGYIGAGQLIERTANTLETMDVLERHRGHFYNWYDTLSLKPLSRYVSTVDSGNLAAHLLTLRAALLEVPDTPIIGVRLFSALGDVQRILVETAGSVAAVPLVQFEKNLKAAAIINPLTLVGIRAYLDSLLIYANEVVNQIEKNAINRSLNEAGEWAHTLVRQCEDALDELVLNAHFLMSNTSSEVHDSTSVAKIPTLRQLANEGHYHARKQIEKLEYLAQKSCEFAQMEYGFLYNPARRLLSIGYNVGERRLDASFYDLLASEARLCNFIAIAQGELPQESWFALGRMLTTAGGEPLLLSWSGSMFEYLMPLLVMPTYDNTLLDQTCKAAVTRQIEYGNQRGVPWGMSESGYNGVDVHLNYQYRAFGVPGLGLKRGLGDDLVIAPYASVMALMVAPEAACSNLQKLAAEGFAGKFGFYEAVDYTSSRLRHGETRAVVRSFMAHHLGMSILSLAYLLLDRPMQRRFESDPLFQATMLLLQERIPQAKIFHWRSAELPEIHAAEKVAEMPIRIIKDPNTPIPEVQLLSNGRYHVMVTNAGGGSSRWKDLAVTRWREDKTCDNWGSFCYLRDVSSGEFWSTAHQPTQKPSKRYEVVFSEDRVEFRRRDHDFDTHTEITVSPEDDIELRRVRITNRAWTRQTIEITTYAEVVLATPAADAQAPAFGNLFVQTEILPERQAILCHRRPRSQSDQTPWMFHLMTVQGAAVDAVSYETDRMRFVGRGNTVAAPYAMTDSVSLSGSAGSVLDPIVAIRQRLSIGPGECATIDIVTGVGDSQHAVLNLIDKYQDHRLADRVFDLARTHSLVMLRQLNASEGDAQLFCRLAGSVLFANASLRADTSVLRNNHRGQSGLWGYAISGDLPIVLLQIGDPANIELVRKVVAAHAYWRLKGLAVDLIIWNEDHSGYRQLLQEQIMGLIYSSVEAHMLDCPGGIFVHRGEQIAPEDRILLQTVARAIIVDSNGSLADQVTRRIPAELPVALTGSTPIRRSDSKRMVALPRRRLLFDNGFGGFTVDGREYVITTEFGKMTPAPWSNVLANPHFGSVISESGQAYTWAENAHEFRLTPWRNDPVSDGGGEAFYLRDEESGYYWSPTPLPKCGLTPYITRHGFGYSVFEHNESGIHSELWVFVALDASVKFTMLKVRNDSGRPRQLSVTGYTEWVLGDLKEKTGMHVITEIDPKTGVLLARNPYNNDFAGRIAFFDTDHATRSVTGDRTEFIGRNSGLKNPAAMAWAELSGRVGPALDPCGAIRVPFELDVDQTHEIVFRLGLGRNVDDVRTLARRFRGLTAAQDALEKVQNYWQSTLGAVQVQTPDQSVNLLMNGWLVYQVLACRMWGRSGYYQSGGAFGFRDQLQDSMALVHAEPVLVREHLLRCAARQFIEGDVQHWWHPPTGRGVRTRCSDDYLWLPLVTCRYLTVTGDIGVLDESVPFLEGRLVHADEESYYDLPVHSVQAASLYEHCVRAINNGLQFGEHGLPLMGAGDWNDGMNLVGIHGKGESIWLAFFLYDVITQFIDVAAKHGDMTFVDRCQMEAARLRKNIELHGWDGQWYLRAFFDDGTPLGSSSNLECRIDSIAQSWSVLSGAGSDERQRQAMEAVNEYLVQRDVGIIQLFDPPFDQSPLNPGYIKGYVPGVRENGGQYTHAAIWATMAFATLGDNQRAWELLEMINPVNHTQTPGAVAVYKTEPYVVAADVYAVSPHTGRGGWSWYTGSAGWLYRLILEKLLGLTLEVDKLRFAPCLPADWKSFSVDYRYRETNYHITVVQIDDTDNAPSVTIDGVAQHDLVIALVNDNQPHKVELRLSGVLA
ncbi:MAG: glucoamylase family protein [Candidatus Nitrotoga sp.]